MQNGPDFDKLIEPFVKIYQETELDLIKHIASHFKLYEDIGFKNSMEWYAKKIAERGNLTQEALNIIADETKIPKKKIIEMLKEAGISTLNFDDIDKLNDSRDFQINVNELITSSSFLDIVENSYKEINNIFKLINTKAIEGANQAYMDVLNKAYVNLRSGNFDYNTSIRKALAEMVEKGITVASYKQKSGKIINYGIESSVRRDVLTAVVQSTNRASTQFAKDMKAEYYEVSQHLGARVTDTQDYRDHSWWQGKVYKIDGSTKEYPNFQETCNEGDVQGIGGANCRHIKWAFFPGISVPKKVTINEEENRKMYNLYQTQRSYERKIRDYKRNIEVAKASNDMEYLDKYKQKLKYIDNEYNQFCEENNLRRKYAREDIITRKYNNPVFEEEYFKEFENLNKEKEHLIYYNLETGKQVGKISNGISNKVSPDFRTYIKTSTAKKESLIAVHNHPQNTSFSLTDMITYNNSRELGAIAVRTDEYIYALSGPKLKSTKENIEFMKEKYKEIKQVVEKENLNIIDKRHKINSKFAKEMGWKYGRIKNDKTD